MLNLVQINSWKSRNPLEILTSSDDLDIICVQEPHHQEIHNTHEHPAYTLIYPDAAEHHRVSIYVKLSSIPPANICPRPDLSKSGDILVVDFTFDSVKLTLIHLYNDCKSRAGVKLLRDVLQKLDPQTKIFLVADSNSHHPLWDTKTKTPMCEDDFELYDLLVAHALLLLTPPDVSTHTSGNVIDLGFSSPALYMSIDAGVDPSLCVGSDHLPIHYTLNFDVVRSKPTKFNAGKMDLDSFLAFLRNKLGLHAVPIISTQEELDEAANFLSELLLAGLECSTPRHRPCSMAKRWWTPLLTILRSRMRSKRRSYQKY
ncbi:Endonuclease/exonuclease/phosphatase [Mycena epipterygia]|nr:Endonuclease/exonuclease/phosphatase [Mycena epipterygia]